MTWLLRILIVVVTKTIRKHKMFADVYCTCSNPECGHRFVANVTFSHTLCPSALTHGQMIQRLPRINGLTLLGGLKRPRRKKYKRQRPECPTLQNRSLRGVGTPITWRVNNGITGQVVGCM